MRHFIFLCIAAGLLHSPARSLAQETDPHQALIGSYAIINNGKKENFVKIEKRDGQYSAFMWSDALQDWQEPAIDTRLLKLPDQIPKAPWFAKLYGLGLVFGVNQGSARILKVPPGWVMPARPDHGEAECRPKTELVWVSFRTCLELHRRP